MTEHGPPATALSPAQWRELEPYVDAALELPVEEREGYVVRLGEQHAALASALRVLLAACAHVEGRHTDVDLPAVLRFARLWDDRLEDTWFAQAIAERFVLEGEVGRGGAAIVHRARDPHTGSVVALKVLRTSVPASASQRFLREIAISARLRHPHVLSVLESGACGTRLWFAMPLVDGESLAARLERDAPLPLQEALRMLCAITDALVAAHAAGIVHRDLKPANVLLSGERLFVADFGVAKARLAAAHDTDRGDGGDDLRTATGVTLGTPGYMAPEQWIGDRTADHRVDLYALGVMAYEMLAGVTPFRGVSRQDMLMAHLSRVPVSLAVLRNDVPAALARLVIRLLAKRVVERPATAAEVHESLNALLRAVG